MDDSEQTFPRDQNLAAVARQIAKRLRNGPGEVIVRRVIAELGEQEALRLCQQACDQTESSVDRFDAFTTLARGRIPRSRHGHIFGSPPGADDPAFHERNTDLETWLQSRKQRARGRKKR